MFLAQSAHTQALFFAASGIFASSSGVKVASMHQHLWGGALSAFGLAITHKLGFWQRGQRLGFTEVVCGFMAVWIEWVVVLWVGEPPAKA